MTNLAENLDNLHTPPTDAIDTAYQALRTYNHVSRAMTDEDRYHCLLALSDLVNLIPQAYRQTTGADLPDEFNADLAVIEKVIQQEAKYL